jgi:hypothetical protein
LGIIREAVTRVHKANIFATELLNLHIRRLLETDIDANLKDCFSANWVLNAYNEVTYSGRKVKVIPELQETMRRCMPPFDPPDRSGVQQCLLYDARNLVTVASTNVWMHFQGRVHTHVKRAFQLDERDYDALSKDEKRVRKLQLLQVATDICRPPMQSHQSPPEYHVWIASERARLGIDAAVGNWGDKPLLYHLKAHPHRFIRSMYLMSRDKEASGGAAFALYPLRRSLVPKHIRFDQKGLRDLLHIGASDFIKAKAKKRRLERGRDVGHVVDESTDPTGPTGRRTKEQMLDENKDLFSQIVDLRAANIARSHRFDYAFTTDGIGARVQMRHTTKKAAHNSLTRLPKRGIWAIDELKRVTRTEAVHIIGIDPGKRELIHGVDMDNTRRGSVRYTLAQRRRETCVEQYKEEAEKDKPGSVVEAEKALAGFNSRSSDLTTFRAYCKQRHATLDACFTFYADYGHRQRRWKRAIKVQKSESKLYERLQALQTDKRPLILAYGAWGLTAGNDPCKRGIPPCIGVGLMRKLSKRFVVVPTPEHCTSKTCFRCLGACSPWKEVEEKMEKKIRGLRLCTQRDCMLPLNRDKNGAINIGHNFERLMRGESPIKAMTEEEVAFHRARLCLDQ